PVRAARRVRVRARGRRQGGHALAERGAGAGPHRTRHRSNRMSVSKDPQALLDSATAWWRTEIIDIAPGRIQVRGYPIEQLIGQLDFVSMIWLMLRGELPTPVQGGLLQAALVASVDHGPQAPSIAIARMAATCGVGVNNAMASGINSL